MERVRYADHMPLVFEVAAISETLIQSFNKEDITEHFFQTLTDHGYEIGKSQQTIYAKNASEKVANYLKIPKNHAVLALTQVSYFTDGRPFEYVHSQYVGDRFEFYLENPYLIYIFSLKSKYLYYYYLFFLKFLQFYLQDFYFY